LTFQVYDKLCYVPLTRIAALSPEIARITLTVGSVGKDFYATGWRVGFLIGPEHLIKYVSRAHTRICFVTVSPLQEAAAIGYEQAGKLGFWQQSVADMAARIKKFNEVWDELGMPVSRVVSFHTSYVYLTLHAVFRARGRLLCPGKPQESEYTARL
jgi:kynurenine aminotransferase